MPKYVALLRGINVGGNKKVEMTKLKKAFESMGYTDVSTYINSGNVLFTSAKENFDLIEPALAKVFKFSIPVIVRSAANIKSVAKKIPKAGWENDQSKMRRDFSLGCIRQKIHPQAHRDERGNR